MADLTVVRDEQHEAQTTAHTAARVQPVTATRAAAASSRYTPPDGLTAVQHAAGNQAVSGALTRQDGLPPAVRALLGHDAGTPLDTATRRRMEQRFGEDFGHVRLHTGDAAAQSARAVSARAYTVGHDVVFGAGHDAPGTAAGARTLAHELAHVVQQRGGGAGAAPPLNPMAAHEQDAARAATQATGVHGPVTVNAATGVGIACAPESAPPPPPPTMEQHLRNLEAYLEATIVAAPPVGSREGQRMFAVTIVVGADGREKGRATGENRGRDHAELSATRQVQGRIAPGDTLLVYVEAQPCPDQCRDRMSQLGDTLAGRGAGMRVFSRYHVTNERALPGGGTQGTADDYPRTGNQGTRANQQRQMLEDLHFRREPNSPGGRSRPPSGSTPPPASGKPPSSPPQAQQQPSTTPSTPKQQQPPSAKPATPTPATPPPAAATTNTAPTTATPAAQPPASKPAASGAPPAPKTASTTATMTAPPPKPAGVAGIPNSDTPTRTEPGQPTPPASKPAQAATSPAAPAPAPKPAAQPPKPTPASPPRIVGPAFKSPSNAVEPSPKAQAGAAAAQGALMVVQGILGALNNMGSEQQRKDAETRLNQERPKIIDALQANPGSGIMVEMQFSRWGADLDTGLRPADRFVDLYWYPATSSRAIVPGLYPATQGAQLHIERRWIQPTQPASAAAQQKAPATANAPTFQDLLVLVAPLYERDPPALLEALSSAVVTFASTTINLGGTQVTTTNANHQKMRGIIEADVAGRLRRGLASAEKDLQNFAAYQARLKAQDDSILWKLDPRTTSRPFELKGDLLDYPRRLLTWARQAAEKKQFREAARLLQQADNQLQSAYMQLYYYDHGFRNAADDAQ